MRYVLVGNYGVGNFGDEALQEYFLSAFPEMEWHVLSAHPSGGELSRLPAGFRSFFLTRWWRTLAALRRSDGLVFGGGTLFTDIESVRACLLWWWHGFMAWVLGRRIILAFQGIGPFRTRMGEWCARWIVARAVFVSVRDAASFERVRSWRKNTNIIQTADPVISLFKANYPHNSSQKLLVVIPRNNSPLLFGERAVHLQENGTWSEIRILSLQPDDPEEQEVCKELAVRVHGTVIPVRTTEDLVSEVCAAAFVLTQRYHGALAALALGVPFEAVAQGEGDKLSTLTKASLEDMMSSFSEGERQLRTVLFHL